MNRLKAKSLLFITVCVFSLASYAQSASCDKLFANGVKLQQTMTISSQRQAITNFEKAKACYDSQSRKDLCDQQITACRNIIAQISKNNNQISKEEPEEKEDTAPVSIVPEQKEVKRTVELSIDCTYIKFKAKGDEFKKAKVTCNYLDWEITEKPSWITYTKNDSGEIVVQVEKNPFKEERSGTMKIECGDKSVSITIIQEKPKRFGII